MQLTVENVDKVMLDCLFKEGEDTASAVLVEGVVNKYGFHPVRLDSHREDVASMLSQLPRQFRKGGGGGWTFLNACETETGEQWADGHLHMESLFCLGIALGMAKWVFPKALWTALPGGMPYVVVNLSSS